MKLSASERNKRIYATLERLISEAKSKKDIVFPEPFLQEEVETLFTSHIWGHREITLTILLARIIDPGFKASKDFYSCNPRSIYEKPIRELLRKNGIPHKKSGPLNVAKNSQRIDEVWAHNKRGDGMALVVAGIVKKIESVSSPVLRNFTLAYVHRYLAEAVRIAKLDFKFNKIEDPIFLANLCRDLIANVPDGGTTPQLIAGLIIESENSGNKNSIKTTGHLDSVSATNTTSKKPGDISEEMSGKILRVYEVTVKQFGVDRIIESHEAIKVFDLKSTISEVFVLCRSVDIPETIKKTPHTSSFLGITTYKDLIYYFVDIFEWIQFKLTFMPKESRSSFYADLVAHVNEINSSEKVKIYFKDWHNKNFR